MKHGRLTGCRVACFRALSCKLGGGGRVVGAGTPTVTKPPSPFSRWARRSAHNFNYAGRALSDVQVRVWGPWVFLFAPLLGYLCSYRTALVALACTFAFGCRRRAIEHGGSYNSSVGPMRAIHARGRARATTCLVQAAEPASARCDVGPRLRTAMETFELRT
jgi:hypothetical protein